MRVAWLSPLRAADCSLSLSPTGALMIAKGARRPSPRNPGLSARVNSGAEPTQAP